MSLYVGRDSYPASFGASFGAAGLKGASLLVLANFASGGTIPASMTYSRSSQATMTDASGNVVYGPNNLIRNSSGSGASAGVPPTNWVVTGTSGNVTITAGAPVTVNGIVYAPFTFSGTANATVTALSAPAFEAATQVSASSGQTWAFGAYVYSTGTIPSVFIDLNERNSGGSLKTNQSSVLSLTGTPAKQFWSATLSNASTTAVLPRVGAFITNGVTYNGTLYIGLPQLSQITAAQTTIPDMPATTGSAYYGPRFTYVNGAPAFLPEGATTNQIRNSTMQGAVVGDVELVSNTLNPLFGTGMAGWTQTSGSVTATAGGGLTITGNGSVNSVATIPIQVVSGVSYTITATVGTNALNVGVGPSQGPDGGYVTLGGGAVTPGTYTTQWTSNVTGTVYLNSWRFSAASSTLTNVSVRRTYVTNGDFAANPINASQNTVQNGWQWTVNGGTGSVTYGSGNVTLTGDGTHQTRISQSLTTVVGTTYTLMIDTNANVFVAAGTSEGSSGVGSATINTGSNGVLQFTATTTTTWIMAAITAASSVTIDNVRVRSAGVLPTNWIKTVSNGTILAVEGAGTINGVPYVDLAFSGTPTLTSSAIVQFDGNAVMAAAQNQTWTGSYFASMPSGSTTNLRGVALGIKEDDNVGAQTAYSQTSFTPSTTSFPRVTGSRTLTSATTAYVASTLTLDYTSGQPFATTIRIGLPQLEQQPAATSVVPTFGTAQIRAAEVAYFTGASLGLGTRGTIIVEVAADDITYGQIIGNDAGLTFLAHASSTTNQVYAQDSAGNAIVATLGSGTVSSPFRAGVAFDGSTISVAAAGGAVASAAGANPSLTKLYLGSRSDGFYMNRPISSVAVYNAKLSDAVLRAKTVAGVSF